MLYPEYVLRQEAAAMRQLIQVGALQLGGATPESATIPLAQLREAARA